MNCGIRITGQLRQRTTTLNPGPSKPGQLLQEHVDLPTKFKAINKDKIIEYQKALKNNDIETLTKISEKAKEIIGLLEKAQKA